MDNVLDTEEVRQQLIVAQRSPFIYYDYYTRVLSSQAKTIYLKLSGAPTSIKSQRKQNLGFVISPNAIGEWSNGAPYFHAYR
jgi:hypothetical protein